MSRAILLSLFAATVVVAGVPVTFSQGSPAKADEVNKNFNYLDSAVGKKASQASLDAVAEALKNKADASALSGKAEQTYVDTKLSEKADQSKLDDLTKTVTTKSSQVYVDTALGRRADTSWVKTRISAAQSASGALLKTNNLSDLGDKSVARTNLGLGALATKSLLNAGDVGALDSNVSKSRFANRASDVIGGVSLMDSRVTAPNGLTSGGSSTTDGSTLLQLNTERSWAFRQRGNGSGSQLALEPDVDDKTFAIRTKGGTNAIFQVYTGGVYSPTVRVSSSLYMDTLSALRDQEGTWLFGYGSKQISIGTTASGSSNAMREIALYNGNGHAAALFTSDSIRLARNTSIVGDLSITGVVKTAAGTIKSSDVADYVFEPDYKLMPLAEVEAFTKSNKHLPEVPSAAEIEKSGLDLAKMNLILLKKVEELTLHTIELEKRLKAVEAKD